MKKRKDIPLKIRSEVNERSGEVCEWCHSQRATQMHHKILRSQQGKDTPENLLHLCTDCHNKAHHDARTIIKMREMIPIERMFD